jgi:heme-degrading monooxygenase HmoA
VHVIVWRFRPREAERAAFEEAYSSRGAWARLFGEAEGFISTELLRAAEGHYLVIDRWDSEASFREFRERFKERYESLDRACEAVTLEETPLGSYLSLG